MGGDNLGRKRGEAYTSKSYREGKKSLGGIVVKQSGKRKLKRVIMSRREEELKYLVQTGEKEGTHSI